MMARPINKKDPRGHIVREDHAMEADTKCLANEAQGQLELLPLR